MLILAQPFTSSYVVAELQKSAEMVAEQPDGLVMLHSQCQQHPCQPA